MLSDLKKFDELEFTESKKNIKRIMISNFPYQIFKDDSWNEGIFNEDFYVNNKNFVLEERIKEFYDSNDECKISNILNTYLLYCRDINREDLLLNLLKKE